MSRGCKGRWRGGYAVPSSDGGFPGDLMREMEHLMGRIESGVAQLRTTPLRPYLELSGADFEVTPTNPKAARFAGHALARDLYLTVGEARREFIGFARGGTIVRGANWRDELQWIWEVVVAGGFTQRHYLGSDGRVIGWSTKFGVHGTEVVFRNGRRAEKLFGHERVTTVTYEPYF